MESRLWNTIEEASIYDTDKVLYQNHMLEQYKMYVEMADRISQRRNLTNVFCLTLCSSIITVIGFSLVNILAITAVVLPFFSALGVVLSVTWWWLLRSYRNLNSAKYKVIGQLEEKLPASPYWGAEWKELGEGKSLKKYLPLTVLEQFVPILFLLFYCGSLIKTII